MIKKTINILFLLATMTFANDTANSIDYKYKEAIKAYKSKDYKTSYNILSTLYISKLSDSKLSFYLGRSAFETGHYEIALAAFERVGMMDPKNIRNKLEMARTYFMLKMFIKSTLLFKEILTNPNLPQNVKTNVELLLAKISKSQQKSFTHASVSIDWIYDSNVNFGSNDSHYNITFQAAPIKATDARSDSARQLYADVVNIYDIGKQNDFAVKNSVKLLMKNYMDLHDFSIKYLSYTPSLIYKERKFLAEFILGYDILKLANIEYLRSISYTPKFEYIHSNTLKSITYFKYQEKIHSQKSKYDSDANHYELAYTIQHILSPSSYIQMNVVKTKEEKAHSDKENGSPNTRVDVDYDEYKIGCNYTNQFTSSYSGSTSIEYKQKKYKLNNSLFASIRNDEGYRIGANVNTKVLKSFNLGLKVNYNSVNSNQAPYSYHKYTISLGISKTF